MQRQPLECVSSWTMANRRRTDKTTVTCHQEVCNAVLSSPFQFIRLENTDSYIKYLSYGIHCICFQTSEHHVRRSPLVLFCQFQLLLEQRQFRPTRLAKPNIFFSIRLFPATGVCFCISPSGAETFWKR